MLYELFRRLAGTRIRILSERERKELARHARPVRHKLGTWVGYRCPSSRRMSVRRT